MSVFEMILSGSCALIVGGAWWWAVTRPAFAGWLKAWADRHSESTRNEITQAWVEGHEAGQEYERLRGSKARS